ncbi:MAG: peptidoglycan-associated lipoprotein Pal [Rhizobiaceae bacterium]
MSQAITSNRLSRLAMVATLAALTVVAGCETKKNKIPGNANQLGINSNAGSGAPGSKQEFTTSVGDRVFFTVDSSALNAEARATLDKQSQWLARYGNYQITIEGHADERGTREYNLALGARRAATTKNYLASKGIPASRMRTISFGKERPVAVCDNISCWSQNRRAVTVLTGGSS